MMPKKTGTATAVTSMSGERIELTKHGCPYFMQCRYWFFPDTGQIFSQRPEDQPPELPPYGSVERALLFRGKFKSFAFGRIVVLYRERDAHFLQIGTDRWRLGSADLRLTRRTYGPLRSFSVRTATFHRTFIEWPLGALIQMATDVTYDALDKLVDDFVGEIMQLHGDQARKSNQKV